MKKIREIGNTPDRRRNTPRRLLDTKPLSQFMEAHSPISALIAENVSYEHNGEVSFLMGFGQAR